MKDAVPLGLKITIIIIPAIVVWAGTFGLSLLIRNDKPFINLTATFFLTLFSVLSVLSMDGEEYNPDKMP